MTGNTLRNMASSMAKKSPSTVLLRVAAWRYLDQQKVNGGVTSTHKPWDSAMLGHISTMSWCSKDSQPDLRDVQEVFLDPHSRHASPFT